MLADSARSADARMRDTGMPEQPTPAVPLNGRTAIVCSARHWTSPIHLSAHHIAKFLVARGWRVAFLSNPTSLLHAIRFAGEEATRARLADWRRGGGWTADGRLFHYTPLSLLPPSRLPGLNSPALFDAWVAMTMPRLVPLLARRGFGTPDLLITESALMAPLWEGLGQPRLVYRVTDRNDDFPGMPTALRAMERRMAAAAELVVVTGDRLLTYAERLAPRATLVVGNGVETAHFATPQSLPPEYAAIPGPRAVYVGAIAEWFDADLVAATARACPGVQFVIIGPGEGRITGLAARPNVHILGPRPYANVPAYLQHADVGLIPFQRAGMEEFVDDINPLKLYEYMAAGLPVVATPMGQVALSGAPVHTAHDAQGFAAAVARLTQAPRDTTAERAFAAGLDWSRQLQPLAERLGL